MKIDGHNWNFDGFAWGWNPKYWKFGWATAVEDDGRPVGERWLCLGPLALCFV